MKQLVVLSGKGGTGKTTLTASLAALLQDAVVVDCDVDAPDLHLLLKPTVLKVKDFYGSKLASIDKDKCIKCGACIRSCRFDAIDDDFNVDQFSCEGCGVCGLVCPANAVSFTQRKAGEIYVSETKYGPMVHALLFPGEENSGKLVTMTRLFANLTAQDRKKSLIIIDGSPGIGCPVISSITNVDYALVITEPTSSGIHDFERLMQLVNHFSVKPLVVINKYDINEENTHRIENYCNENDITVLGKIPFDPIVVEAMVQGVPVVEYNVVTPATIAIKDIFQKVTKILEV
ncbi:P-loop NTPase [Caldisericum sp. AR60]|uniref:nucleotide-binding protein n=1 Tax=Caldisericum sp. AR60 TaxID=3397852 RepID=UPI0039FBBC60